jgi:mono/diheme cytochrome c family protein
VINRETGLPSNPLVETTLKAIAGWIRATSTKFLLPVCSSIAVLIAGNLVQAQDDLVSHGKSLVAEFCARCHAIGIRGESPHPWAPPFRTLGRTVDLNEFPRALERGITSIHPDMPAIKFSQEEARAVRAYLWVIQQ